MDVPMPVMDGIEATRRIGAAAVKTRVLVLTTFDGEEHAYEALRAGAAGYLLKDVGGQRLVRPSRRPLPARCPLRRRWSPRLVAQYVRRPPLVTRPTGRLDCLTERELEVLVLIGQGWSNPEIAEQLVISLPTVKSHVRHILAKLDLRDRPQAAVLTHECGLVGSA